MEKQNQKNSIKNTATILASLVVAVFFMWLALRGLDFEKITAYYTHVNYLWVLVAAVFAVAAYWLRAKRWRLLFQPLGMDISTADGFWAIAFGYLMNLTIPRSGEVARATALYRRSGVPVQLSFGTVILERVIDLLCMLALLAAALVFKLDAVQTFFAQAQNQRGTANSIADGRFGLIIGFLIGLAILGIVLLYLLRHQSWMKKVLHFLRGIKEGIFSIAKLQRPGLFVLYSISIWVCYYLAAYLICFALPATAEFTPSDGLFIIVIGTLGMLVPASGGIGAFHYAIKMGIGALFLAAGKSFETGAETGLAYAFVSHTMQTAVTVLIGLYSIIPIFRANRTLAQGTER